MPRVRNTEQAEDTAQPFERLAHRAKKHNAKIDKAMTKLVEEQREKIEGLSKANLRLTRLLHRLAHYLPKERLAELRAEVDTLANLDTKSFGGGV